MGMCVCEFYLCRDVCVGIRCDYFVGICVLSMGCYVFLCGDVCVCVCVWGLLCGFFSCFLCVDSCMWRLCV